LVLLSFLFQHGALSEIHDDLGAQVGTMLQLLSLSALLFVPGAHHRPSLRRRCRACVVAEVPLPTSPKDIATQMSYAVQAALAAGKTELAISLPGGMRFGLFGDAGKQVIGTPGAAPSLAQAQRAEFELVFLCAEMFRGECTCVFQSAAAVKAAEREFASKGLRPRIVPNVGKVAAKAAMGFGKKSSAGAAEKSAVQAKVIILSQPSAADLKKLTKPEEGLVLIINPRKRPAEYEQVYLLEDNPHPDWEGGLLFRAFPDDWALGVAGASVAGFGGAPTVHGRSPSRPLLEAIEKGFVAIKGDSNPFVQGVGAAAALRRRGTDGVTNEDDEDDEEEQAEWKKGLIEQPKQ